MPRNLQTCILRGCISYSRYNNHLKREQKKLSHSHFSSSTVNVNPFRKCCKKYSTSGSFIACSAFSMVSFAFENSEYPFAVLLYILNKQIVYQPPLPTAPFPHPFQTFFHSAREVAAAKFSKFVPPPVSQSLYMPLTIQYYSI